MANYYYVKNGGTAVGTSADSSGTYGIATSPLTGAWSGTPSNYFASMEAVKSSTEALADGDFIYCSDASVITDVTSSTAFPSSVTIMSVDDTARDEYKAGASESGNDYTIKPTTNKELTFIGMSLKSTDDFPVSSGVRAKVTFVDCTLDISAGAADSIALISDVGLTYLYNCRINIGASTTPGLLLAQGNTVYMDGITTTGSKTDMLMELGIEAGKLFLYSVDIDALVSDNGYLFSNSTLYSGNSTLHAELYRCSLPTGFTNFNSETPAFTNWSIEYTSCSNGTGYHYFAKHSPEGDIVEDTTNYLSATWDEAETEGFSAQISSTGASVGIPLRHKLWAKAGVDLTSATTFRVNLNTNAVRLNNAICYIEIVTPKDSTQTALGDITSSRIADILDDSSDLPLDTTNDAAWESTGIANDMEQYISKEVSARSGVNNATVEVWLCVAAPNIDVWACPDVVIT